MPGPEEGSFIVSRKADIDYISQYPEGFKSEADTRVWRAGKYRAIALEALSHAKVEARGPMPQALIGELIAAARRRAMLFPRLRYGTPAITTPRRVAKDTELAGMPMPAGAAVDVLWGSGSHDEQYFAAPESTTAQKSISRAPS